MHPIFIVFTYIIWRNLSACVTTANITGFHQYFDIANNLNTVNPIMNNKCDQYLRVYINKTKYN